MLFIRVNVQNRTVLIIILVNLLGKSLSESDRDKKAHLFKHAVVNEDHNANCDDFKIIGSGFRNDMFKRKFAEGCPINRGIPTNFEHSGEVG